MSIDEDGRQGAPRGASDDDLTPPWWAPTADEDAPLPDGFPDRPDISKVHSLRQRVKTDHAAREADRDALAKKLTGRMPVSDGKQARDIGSYTLIPMMMVAGPALGYLLGRVIQHYWGGEPWPMVGGVLFGLAAAFRQIYLLLAGKTR